MNCFILIFLTAQMFLMIDEQTFLDENILKYFPRTKQTWMDLANSPGQRYSKILSEVKTRNPSGQKHCKIGSTVKTSMSKLSKLFWTKVLQITFRGQTKHERI